MAKNKEISIRFIAEKCGVSTATVSRVFNHSSTVSEKTRLKVMEVLQQYQYAPLRSTVPNKIEVPPTIGIIMRSSISDYYTNLQQHVAQYFMKKGIRVLVCNMQDEEYYLLTAVQTLYDSNVLGIILISCDYTSIKKELPSDIVYVWIDCNDKPEETTEICQVQSDHYASGQLAAQELCRRGSKKPLLFTSSVVTHRAEERIAGFRNMCKKNNVVFEEQQIIYLPYIKNHFIESRDMVQYLIAKEYSFDSIFAINDPRALGAVIGVQNSGLRIPDDIRIIGFDGISITCNTVLNITSIQQNTELLARTACEMLEKQINKKEIQQKRVVISPHLIVGQTT